MKRIAMVLGMTSGGIAVFFLSTFFFLSLKGELNVRTLTRLPGIGPLFGSVGDPDEQTKGAGILTLERTRVPLEGDSSGRVLQSQFVLGIEGESSTARQFVIRDAIHSVCRQKTAEELDGDLGLSALKREVAAAVEQALFPKGEGKVTEVYVSEFLVQ